MTTAVALFVSLFALGWSVASHLKSPLRLVSAIRNHGLLGTRVGPVVVSVGLIATEATLAVGCAARIATDSLGFERQLLGAVSVLMILFALYSALVVQFGSPASSCGCGGDQDVRMSPVVTVRAALFAALALAGAGTSIASGATLERFTGLDWAMSGAAGIALFTVVWALPSAYQMPTEVLIRQRLDAS